MKKMKKVYVINIEWRLEIVDETTFETLKQGFDSYENAKDFVLNTLIPKEKKESWISMYEDDALAYSQSEKENTFYWECVYNDYEKYTSIFIEEVNIY